MNQRLSKQKGAALVIVLLLVATLSFILLSTTSLVTASVNRSASDRARTEMLWRAAAAEVMAKSILEKYLASNPPKMARNDGVFGGAIEMPFATGKGVMIFADATRCFNVNSLVDAGGIPVTAEVDNFVSFVTAFGLGEGEARKLGDVIVDFLDTEFQSQPQGAEDNFYTALPTPFRTAQGPIASVSELRAMDGVSRKLYRRLKPYLCANADTKQPEINLNLLEEGDAPLIHALTGGQWALDEIKNQIAAAPPGGWAAAADFWAPFVSAGGAIPASPTAITSNRIKVFVRLEVNDRTMEEALLFEAAGTDVRLLARSFGEEF